MILCMNNKIIEIEIKNDVFYAGVPSNKININQLPKWIRILAIVRLVG